MTKAYARKTDLNTSHVAASKVSGERATNLMKEVFHAIDGEGLRGATWDECAGITGIDKASVSPRFKPLRKKCWIFIKRNIDGSVAKRGNQTVWVSTYYAKSYEKEDGAD